MFGEITNRLYGAANTINGLTNSYANMVNAGTNLANASANLANAATHALQAGTYLYEKGSELAASGYQRAVTSYNANYNYYFPAVQQPIHAIVTPDLKILNKICNQLSEKEAHSLISTAKVFYQTLQAIEKLDNGRMWKLKASSLNIGFGEGLGLLKFTPPCKNSRELINFFEAQTGTIRISTHPSLIQGSSKMSPPVMATLDLDKQLITLSHCPSSSQALTILGKLGAFLSPNKYIEMPVDDVKEKYKIFCVIDEKRDLKLFDCSNPFSIVMNKEKAQKEAHRPQVKVVVKD